MRLLFPKLNYMVYIYIHAYIIAIDAGPAIFYISHDTIFHWGLVEHDHTVFNNLLINQPHTWNNLVAICLFLLSSAASLSLSLSHTELYTQKSKWDIWLLLPWLSLLLLLSCQRFGKSVWFCFGGHMPWLGTFGSKESWGHLTPLFLVLSMKSKQWWGMQGKLPWIDTHMILLEGFFLTTKNGPPYMVISLLYIIPLVLAC